jgi:hypothetical protein
MENIKAETSDINPLFWKEFIEEKNNSLEKMCLENKGYAPIFDLLIFIINKVKDVYSASCKNYLDLLNILSVYSILCKEFIVLLDLEEIDSNLKNNIISDFVGILSSEELYNGLFVKNEDKDITDNNLIDKNIESLINRVKKLYLILINII